MLDCKWDRIIFSYESTFSSTTDGPVLVYRLQGERTTLSIYLPAHAVVLGLFTVGAGMLHHTEGHLDGLQYKHILQNVKVPFVRMLHPDGIIRFKYDHSSIHVSHVVQEWLLLQADVEFIDWSPCVPDIYTPSSLNCACFTHNFSVYSKHVQLGVKQAIQSLFQFFWQPSKICKTNCE